MGTVMISGKNGCIDWSAARFKKNGEKFCGDDFLIYNYQDQILVAVVDGLGHGEYAMEATKKAIDALKNSANKSLISMIKLCHKELKKTRGAVMSLAVFDCCEHTMSWAGIGNVEGSFYQANEKKHDKKKEILLRGGVVGYKLPVFKDSVISVSDGDTLIFTTDGVENKYIENVKIHQTTEQIAEFIATNFIVKSDDALVLVARYTQLSHRNF